MKDQNRIVRRFCFALGLLSVLVAPTFTTARSTNTPSANNTRQQTAAVAATLDLSDYGAAGDGNADDGPAFQRALDALAEAGGGTLLVPAGTYLVATPVVKDFSGVNVTIQGVPSDTMPAPPTATGQELSAGLNLTSRIVPATGPNASALKLTNLRELTIEHIDFTGRPESMTDAFVSLYLVDIGKATLRHCEFYGLSSFGISDTEGGGNIVRAVRSQLSIELSVFLGCTANSGAYGAVVENLQWLKFSISNSIFLDYGQRAFFGKTGLGAPISWIDVGNAAFPTAESPRREFVVRDTFLDEGGWVGISAFPYRWGPYSKIDLVYISGLKMNVPNMGTTGHLFYDLDNLLIENSHYGWSQNAYAAIDIYRVGNAIYDNLNCIDHANRLTADSLTGRLTVINSNYAQLDSNAQITNVVSSAPEEDPVQYVRNQFVSTLDRPPDPAAHFYWSDLLIRCGGDTDCLNQQRSQLSEYLSRNPQPDFSIAGTVADEFGQPLPDAVITLSGSQSTSVISNAQGTFQFSNLPTSGIYTVTVNKAHYNFPNATYTFSRPDANVNANFAGRINRHSIHGRVIKADGSTVSGVTLHLAQSPDNSIVTDDRGNYMFSDLAEGGTYTVVPASTDFAFTPVSQTFADLSADQTVDFVAQQTSFLLAGKVLDESDMPISGATLTLTGAVTASTLTDAQGNFRFLDLPTGGSYAVSVNKEHYTFSQGSETLSNPLEDVIVEFSGSLNRHRISGRLVRQDGTALSGVTVQLDDYATTTDSNGYYSFAEVAAGETYTITPISTDFAFTPASKTFADLGADQTADFSGQSQLISIRGKVSDANGNPLAGVTIDLTGSQSISTTTDASGSFQILNLPMSGTYTVSVSKTHYTFTTSTRSFDHPTQNVTADFSGSLNRHSISGRITRVNGDGIGGLTVQLGQTPATSVVTDANGYYSFTALAAGQNYAVAPSSSAFVFTPANKALDDLAADVTGNFVGKIRPRIITADGSEQAIALDSLSLMAGPFSILSSLGFSSDGLTRLVIFATDVDATELSQLSLVALDDAGVTYPLVIEKIDNVRDQSWMKQVNFKLSQNLPSGKCVWLRLGVGDVTSNDARMCISPR